MSYLKIGIEIHQRLETKKLFCDCPSNADSETPLYTIKRKLHPVLSELGELDRAASAESQKDREFIYQVYSNNCFVETDEEPPTLMNKKALKIALDISLKLNATPLEEIHVMRKMVVDGSNTSGFQRTSIIAVNGHIDTSKGRVDIPLIAIEEDSAGIVTNSETSATYRLDRLGIPLIEISTSPQIKDGEHLFEVAQKIGLILRASGNVSRGLGTIRQDVNVSTEGGSRVEIKGAQDLKMLSEIASIEEKRQLELIKILSQIREKNPHIIYNPVDVTTIFENTNSPMLKKGISEGQIILAQKLPAHKGILGLEIQPGKRYGTELSEYSKRAGVKGIIHSDENLEKYSITKQEIEKIERQLGMKFDDAFILVLANSETAKAALLYAIERAKMDFVPGETRRANPDGTSTFMRPLPGKARMYPETDVPPISVNSDFLNSIIKTESLDEKRIKLTKLLNPEMTEKILKSRNLHLFEKLLSTSVDPMLLANTLENTIVALRREGFEITDPDKTLTDLFTEYKKDTFVKAAIPDILKVMSKGARAESAIKVYRFGKITGSELEKIVSENKCNVSVIMQKFRLQVDPAEVSELSKKLRCDDPAYK